MSIKLPKHIAIVMDGNGRWALSRGKLRIEGHKAGLDVVKSTVKSCIRKKIPVLSLFAFSSENWSRPAEEVEFLMSLFIKAIEKEIEELDSNGVQLRFIGDRAPLSRELADSMQKAEQRCKKNTSLILNIAMNYSGKWDILQAVQKLALSALKDETLFASLDEKKLSNYLCCSDLPEPDLFIRTSGEQRISNFFLWQLAYTELYFSQLPWPDFDEAELDKALESYSQRERRYGRTSKQLKQDNHV